ncbi:hypothetical protein ACFVHS_20675 [Streptomyces sp. NPDC057746]|uniref:hypothetical protein n=1 Tax=unclassified Streptomyces TaxID=2593676 RepID=UPI0033A4C369
MATRSIAVTAAVAVGAALVATGITDVSPAFEPQAAPAAQRVAVALAPESDDKGNDGNGYGYGNGGSGGDREDNRRGRWDYFADVVDRVHVNERDYAAVPSGCITVVSGLGAKSLNVRNDSRKTIEVFSGATCDNGAPIATVGPFSSSNGLVPRHVEDGVEVEDGVVGSFRVVREHVFVEREDHYYGDHDHDYDDDYDYDYEGGGK